MLAGTARRTLGFWLLAATEVLFFGASSAPSPLYVVYQARWQFSSFTLTVVFAAYAAALLLTLLTMGGLSDYLGRRRVIAASLLLELAAMVAFLTAHGVGWLVVARGVQGVATGLAAGALSAAVSDLVPGGRLLLATTVNTAAPSIGLAAGALASGALVQYAPSPRILVFVVFAVAFAVLLVAVAVVPETVRRRPGAVASVRPRAAVPPQARTTFRAAAPVLVATWAVGGLALSLGPSLAAGIFGVRNHVVGGLVVTAVAGVSALGSVVARGAAARPTMVRGSLVLVVGVALVLGSLAATSTTLFFVGLVITGWGFGTAFIGAFGSVALLAEPEQRAELFAAVYAASYLSFGGSAVLAGLAVPTFGLRPVATGYGAAVIALSLLAAGLGRRPTAVATGDPLDARPGPVAMGAE